MKELGKKRKSMDPTDIIISTLKQLYFLLDNCDNFMMW